LAWGQRGKNFFDAKEQCREEKRQRRLNLKVQPAGTASPFDRHGGGAVIPEDFEKCHPRPLIGG
jgi:hypothetical protein